MKRIKLKGVKIIPTPIVAETVLDKVITGTMVNGVLNEVTAVLPIILPVAITFIAIRKGISFVIGMLRSA